MDPVTHGVLGAALAQAVLHKQDKHNAWLVGALAGMAPDLDIVIRSANDPLLFFLYHRHFTHSLLFIPVGAMLVTVMFLMFKRFRKNWRLTFVAAIIGYATHGLLDACTTYGTVLFWPFSEKRISWDIVSIIDLFITVPLLLGVAWTHTFGKHRIVIMALILTGSIMIFNVYQHHRALSTIQAEIKKMHLEHSNVRAFPKLASSTSWKGFAMGNRLLVFEVMTPLFKTSQINLIKNYPLFLPEALPEYVKRSSTLLRDFKIFNWFSDAFLIPVTLNPLLLADGRFLYDDNPGIALWGTQFLPDQEHVNMLYFLNLES